MKDGTETSSADDVLVVLSTCPPGDARRLADFLVEGRYAACVNIIPSLESVYVWEGKLAREAESLLVIKAPAAGFELLREALVREHPYDVPEVVALPVTTGHPPYLAWVLDETRARAGGGS